ncbi:MAG TPA: hypothetical protein VHN16_12770 [Streptosporangiaceae bacterium]|nr:hypothetical protein [Streptosporangiaceae bacterium]
MTISACLKPTLGAVRVRVIVAAAVCRYGGGAEDADRLYTT